MASSTSADPWTFQLPREISREIVAYLGVRAVLRLALGSHRSWALTTQFTPRLDFSQLGSQATKDRVRAVIRLFHSVETLCLSRCFSLSVPALFAEDLPNLHASLRSLDVSGLAQFPGLTSLDLSLLDTLLEPQVTAIVRHLPNLQKLYLSGCYKLSPATFHSIARNCPNLQYLTAATCYLFDKSSLDAILANCKRISRLDISFCLKLEEVSDFSAFRHHGTELTKLALRYSKIQDEAVRTILLSATNLYWLNFGYCDLITNKTLSYLANYSPKLSTLLLWRCTSLDFFALKEVIERCPRLRHLDISGWVHKVKDEDLRFIMQNATRLEKLNISYSFSITDAGIEWLSQTPRLQQLEFYRCEDLTDRSIYSLASHCTRLSSLYCGGCPKISQQALNFLCQTCPMLAPNNDEIPDNK